MFIRPKYKFILYKQYTTKKGNHPVYLYINHGGKIRRFKIGKGYECTPDQWIPFDRPGAPFGFTGDYPNLRDNDFLRSFDSKIDDFLKSLSKQNKPFSFSLFEKRFYTPVFDSDISIYAYIEKKTDELRTAGEISISTKEKYISVKNALKKYSKKENLVFEDIDHKFLEDLERYLREKGLKGSGIKTYFRNIRAIFNKAIGDEIISEDLFPFAQQGKTQLRKFKMSRIKEQDPVKRGLNDREIEKIKEATPDDVPGQAKELLMFQFMYYAGGMEFTDLCRLTWSDITENSITYARQKTNKRIEVPLTDSLNQILEYFRPGVGYVFDIIGPKQNSEGKILYKIGRERQNVNNKLEAIANILKIRSKLTTKVAKHSALSKLARNSNISHMTLKDVGGHSDFKTTMKYMNASDLKEKRIALEKL